MAISEVSASSSSTRDVNSYAQMDSMTLTPGAGNYFAIGSFTIELSEGASGASDNLIDLAFFVNGTMVPEAEIHTSWESSFWDDLTGFYTFMIFGVVSPGASEAVDVRWKVDGLGSLTGAYGDVTDRRLTLIPIDTNDICELWGGAYDTNRIQNITTTSWNEIWGRQVAGTNKVSGWEWIQSPTQTNEYYLRLSGGGRPGYLGKPKTVFTGSSPSAATEGTVGSLAAGEWGWGDNDSLGFSTVYYRDPSTPTDPDSYTTFEIWLGASCIPGAGDYLILAQIGAHGEYNAVVNDVDRPELRVYINGSFSPAYLAARALWEASYDDTTTDVWPLTVVGKATLTAGQDVSLRVAMPSGANETNVDWRRLILIKMGSNSGDCSVVGATGTSTATNTADALVNSLTFTDPGAGDYIGICTGSLSQATAGNGRIFSFYKGSTRQDSSQSTQYVETSNKGTAAPTGYTPWQFAGKIASVGATDEVEVHSKGNGSDTTSFYERSFVIWAESASTPVNRSITVGLEHVAAVNASELVPIEHWSDIPASIDEHVIRRVSPTLDGIPVRVANSSSMITLNIPAAEYTTPFWIQPDGISARAYRVNSLPAKVVLKCEYIEILSSAP